MTNVRKNLGERIRFLRQQRKLSQEAFADICGLHRTYLGAIERGERNVSIDNLDRIAKGFGITISQLVKFAKTRRGKNL